MLLHILNMAHLGRWLSPGCRQHVNGLLLEEQEQDACCWLSTRNAKRPAGRDVDQSDRNAQLTADGV